jgi:hypothetical protein
MAGVLAADAVPARASIAAIDKPTAARIFEKRHIRPSRVAACVHVDFVM